MSETDDRMERDDPRTQWFTPVFISIVALVVIADRIDEAIDAVSTGAADAFRRVLIAFAVPLMFAIPFAWFLGERRGWFGLRSALGFAAVNLLLWWLVSDSAVQFGCGIAISALLVYGAWFTRWASKRDAPREPA